tara:strand:+ start:17 stop:160 length:144 start_codon:yes stop_codon:yes gene_type:complete
MLKIGIIVLLLYLLFGNSIKKLFFKKNKDKINSSGVKYKDAEFEEMD